MFALLLLLACLPAPDFRRPATLVTFEGPVPPGVTVRVCTWSTRHGPLEGCENLTDGMPAVDGIGVPEWTEFPLRLGMQSPYWADVFVACEGARPRGATARLPDLPGKHDAELVVKLDQPPPVWGASKQRGIDEATLSTLLSRLCEGTVPLFPA